MCYVLPASKKKRKKRKSFHETGSCLSAFSSSPPAKMFFFRGSEGAYLLRKGNMFATVPKQTG